MRKITLRALALLLAVTIIAGTAIGCRSESESAFPPPEYVFLPEIIPFPRLPGEMSSPEQMVVIGDSVYFSVRSFEGEFNAFSSSMLFEMDIDGSNLRQLPDYYVPQRPPEAVEGGVNINFLHADSDGNLWVVETGSFNGFNLPEDFVEDADEEWLMWEYFDVLESFNAIRKLDSDGAEILSVDIDFIADAQEWFWVTGFSIDGDGNLYIGTHNGVDVISPDGEPLFALDGSANSLITLPDGTVANMSWGTMTKIDLAAEDWGDIIEVPINAHTAFSGNDEFLFVFSDSIGLFGFDEETNEAVQIVNWIDSEVSADSLRNISFLDDGRLFVTSENWRMEGGSDTELVFLTRIRYEDLPERILLTLATFNTNTTIRNAVVEFNRTSATHRIQVVDYSRYSTGDDFFAGLTRLTTEIIAGRVPDIIEISDLPYQHYAARGLLMDLYSFIDEDPELSRSDLVEDALRAIEIDGELPFVFSTFGIATVIGDPAVLGATPGWTMDEFRATLDANPQADVPMGSWLTREAFLMTAFGLGMHNFVDWVAGTVNFDGGDFAALLEIAITFPPQPTEEAWARGDVEWDWVDEGELIATGRQIMDNFHMWDFQAAQRAISLFGGDFVFKGFPTENRNGHSFYPSLSFAITTSSIDPDGAWDFVRNFLTEDFQQDYTWLGFPTNRAVFENEMEAAMTPSEYDVTIDWGWGGMAEEPLTQAQVDRILDLIASMAGTIGQHRDLMEIVEESADEFFTGQITAQDAARFVQGRAAIYVSEVS